MNYFENVKKGFLWVQKHLSDPVKYNKELFHHGIKGQKWGVRNGPPYPLDKNSKKPVVKSQKRAKIDDIGFTIFRSVGARARNYKVLDPTTGKYYYFAEGTRIKNPKVFAGKGGVKKLYPEVAEGLSEQIGGKPENWQHCKGIGTIDDDGEDRDAEVHWFQEETVGKHRFKIKEWLD